MWCVRIVAGCEVTAYLCSVVLMHSMSVSVVPVLLVALPPFRQNGNAGVRVINGCNMITARHCSTAVFVWAGCCASD